MLSLVVHVAAAGRPELLSAPLARVELGHVVDGVDVPSDVGRSGEGLVADGALVLRVLVPRLGVDRQAGLGLVALAAVPAFVRRHLGIGVCVRVLVPFSVDLLHVSLQARALRKSSLAERADQEGRLVLLIHVAVQSCLVGEDLVAVLARKALADVIVEPLNVGQEVVLLQEQLVADEAFKGLPVVRGGKVKLQLGGGPEDDVALPATLVQLPVDVGPVLEVVPAHVG